MVFACFCPFFHGLWKPWDVARMFALSFELPLKANVKSPGLLRRQRDPGGDRHRPCTPKRKLSKKPIFGTPPPHPKNKVRCPFGGGFLWFPGDFFFIFDASEYSSRCARPGFDLGISADPMFAACLRHRT